MLRGGRKILSSTPIPARPPGSTSAVRPTADSHHLRVNWDYWDLADVGLPALWLIALASPAFEGQGEEEEAQGRNGAAPSLDDVI